MQAALGAEGSAYSALAPAFSQAEIQTGPLQEGIATSPRGVPPYCGSSPLPQALCVWSYQMQITFPTLLAGSLPPQWPLPVFFSPARFAMPWGAGGELAAPPGFTSL